MDDAHTKIQPKNPKWTQAAIPTHSSPEISSFKIDLFVNLLPFSLHLIPEAHRIRKDEWPWQQGCLVQSLRFDYISEKFSAEQKRMKLIWEGIGFSSPRSLVCKIRAHLASGQMINQNQMLLSYLRFPVLEEIGLFLLCVLSGFLWDTWVWVRNDSNKG